MKRFNLLLLSICALAFFATIGFSEQIMVGSVKLYAEFDNTEALRKAQGFISATKLEDPYDIKYVEYGRLLFREGKVVVELKSINNSDRMFYYLIYDLNGHFIEGYKIKEKYNNSGVRNVFLNDSKLYFYQSSVNCVYGLSYDSIKFFQVDETAKDTLSRYDETLTGYSLDIDQRTKRILIKDETGHIVSISVMPKQLQIGQVVLKTDFTSNERLQKAKDLLEVTKLPEPLHNIDIADTRAYFREGKIVVNTSVWHKFSWLNSEPYDRYYYIYDMGGEYLEGFRTRMQEDYNYRNLFIVNDACFLYFQFIPFDESCVYEIDNGVIQDYYVARRSMYDDLLHYNETMEGYHLDVSKTRVLLINESLGESIVIWTNSLENAYYDAQGQVALIDFKVCRLL